MGRHAISLSEAQMAEVETLAAVLTAQQVADYFGIGRRTFFEMMQRDEEIAARYKRGKARAIGVIAQGLINKARAGDTASMIFFLKTQAGWRETALVEHDLPGECEERADDGFRRLIALLDGIAERTGGSTVNGSRSGETVGACRDVLPAADRDAALGPGRSA